MAAEEWQSWLPAILAFASAVATVAVLRFQQKHTDLRLQKIEKAIEHITPRAAEVVSLRGRVEDAERHLAQCREILIMRGWLLPEATPRPRARTPMQGVPLEPRDSDDGEES